MLHVGPSRRRTLGEEFKDEIDFTLEKVILPKGIPALNELVRDQWLEGDLDLADEVVEGDFVKVHTLHLQRLLFIGHFTGKSAVV